MTEKTRKILSLLAILLFIILSLVIALIIGKPIVENMKNPERFRNWVDSHGFLGRLTFVGALILQVFVAIIPGEPFEIFAGYAFGAVEGTLLCILGITVGSMLVFWFVRTFGVRAIEVFFPRDKINSLRIFSSKRRLHTLMFLLMIIPGTPKDLLSYFVGLTRMKPLTWLLITLVARLPSIFTSTIGGNALGKKDYRFAIWVFGITMIVGAIGLVFYNHQAKKKEQQEA